MLSLVSPSINSQSFFQTPQNKTEKLLTQFNERLQRLERKKIAERQIYDFIKCQDINVLIEACEANEKLNEFCHAEALVEHWNQLLIDGNKLTAWLNTHATQPSYKPVPNIHSFDLIRGVFYADLGYFYDDLPDPEYKKLSIEYLNKAEQYGNFAASMILNQTRCDNMTRLLQAQAPLTETFQLIHDFTKANLKYGPAGYIELGMLYLTIAQHCPETSSALQLALQHFHTALLLESSCENMVYNAYQNDLICIINDKKFFSLKDIYHYCKAAFNNVSTESIQLAETAAKKQAALFKNNIKPVSVNFSQPTLAN